MRIIKAKLTALLAMGVAYPALAQALSVGDCYVSIEDMHMAIEESNLPQEDLNNIDAALNRAASACDANKPEEGFHALKDANDLYNVSMAEANGDVTPAEFWQKADDIWGNQSHAKNMTYEQAFISCDEKLDYVGWRLDLDNPDNPGLSILAVTKNDAGELKTAYVTLPLGEGQYSLCTADGAPPPEVHLDEQVSEAFAKELGDIEVCSQIIRIDDGMCDNIRLMWPKKDAGKEVAFVLHRN